MAGSRYLALRWEGSCTSCGTRLAARTRAWWDADSRTITCLVCRHEAPPVAPPTSPPVSPPVAPDPPRAGRARASGAGASAQREYERRKAKDEQRVRDAHPHIGGFILKVRGEPQHVTAWARGAAGERELGRGLDQLASERVFALHDRRIPGRRANIDHIVVAPSGIYVVDAKRYQGKVERRDKGTLLRTDLRLYVGRRDCSRLLDGMGGQVEAVRAVVGTAPPVHPVLCFVDSDWGLFTRPFRMRGVLVCWPRALAKRVRAPDAGTPEQVAHLAELLTERLPPA